MKTSLTSKLRKAAELLRRSELRKLHAQFLRCREQAVREMVIARLNRVLGH